MCSYRLFRHGDVSCLIFSLAISPYDWRARGRVGTRSGSIVFCVNVVSPVVSVEFELCKSEFVSVQSLGGGVGHWE